MTSRRPIAIALATSAFYAGIFVTTAHAEMHYVRVTLVTGQQITITVDIPPGTPVDQLQIPGLPAPIASIVDLGSTESTPTPTATAPPVVTVEPTATATPTPAPSPSTTPSKGNTGNGKTDDKAETPTTQTDEQSEEDANKATGGQGQHRVAHRQGRHAHADPHPDAVPDSQVDPPSQADPTFSLAEPGAARAGVPNFFIDKFKIPPFLLPIYQAAGTEYGIRWEVLAAINEIETNYGRLNGVTLERRRRGLDAVHARHLEGVRRRRQQGRPRRSVQPGRRDLRRRALPEGRGRRQGPPRRRLGLQPRRLVRGLRPPARAGDRRHAGRASSPRSRA